MYKNSHPPGPIQAHLRRMIGVTAKGETEEVTANVVGLAPPAIERKFTRPMLLGNFSGARELIDRLNLKRQDPFVELRLEGETYTVTDTGIVEESSPVITYRVDSSDSGPHP